MIELTNDLLKQLKSVNFNTLSEDQAKEIRDTLLRSAVLKARDDFYTFVLVIANVMLPEGFVNGRHIKIICDELQSLEKSVAAAQEDQRKRVKEDLQRKAERLQIFLPPGGMKSMILKMFVGWCFGRHPKWRFLHFGHGTEFAIKNFGRPIKELLNFPEYKAIFPETKIKADAAKAQSFETVQGGTYHCAGAGAGVAGLRAHITICDDVLSEQDAYSQVERDKVNKWYSVGPRQRLLPCGGEVIVNTRWHTDDLSGSRTKADGTTEDENPRSERPWKIISFPAILDERASELLGLPIGESFWPELWPSKRLLEFKHDPSMPPSRWNALYMQNPTPEEGNIIKQEMFKRWPYEKPPSCDYIVISMDTAFSTSTKADYSAYTVWGIFKNKETGYDGRESVVSNMILLEANKNRWEFHELMQTIHSLRSKFDPDSFIVEKRASGQSVIQEMRRQGLPVIEYDPQKDRDKISRLHSCVPLFHAGRIWVPEGRNWAEEVVEEVCGFPFAPNDDLTDTVSQAVIWMRDSWHLDHPDDPDYEEAEDNFARATRAKTYWQSASSAGF